MNCINVNADGKGMAHECIVLWERNLCAQHFRQKSTRLGFLDPPERHEDELGVGNEKRFELDWHDARLDASRKKQKLN